MKKLTATLEDPGTGILYLTFQDLVVGSNRLSDLEQLILSKIHPSYHKDLIGLVHLLQDLVRLHHRSGQQLSIDLDEDQTKAWKSLDKIIRNFQFSVLLS
jgi:hypothetical protein